VSRATPGGGHNQRAGLSHCPNCGRLLDGAFCAGCGQKAAALNPTLHDFFHDLTHELLHVDGKIFTSVRLLLLRPGLLSREWFEGRRARYISPIRLYLIFSVLFFAVSAIGSSLDVNITPLDRDEMANAPESVKRAIADPRGVADRVGQWIPRAIFVLVPMFAVIVSAVTRSAGRNYPQDLYFAFHTHAAVFAFLAVSTLLQKSGNEVLEGLLEVLGFAYVPWYLVVGLRTAYGGSWRRAVARAAIVGTVYGIAIVTAIAVVAMIAVFGPAKAGPHN
jgi:hypothetical protein